MGRYQVSSQYRLEFKVFGLKMAANILCQRMAKLLVVLGSTRVSACTRSEKSGIEHPSYRSLRISVLCWQNEGNKVARYQIAVT